MIRHDAIGENEEPASRGVRPQTTDDPFRDLRTNAIPPPLVRCSDPGKGECLFVGSWPSLGTVCRAEAPFVLQGKPALRLSQTHRQRNAQNYGFKRFVPYRPLSGFKNEGRSGRKTGPPLPG
jgi:hypothetical protein